MKYIILFLLILFFVILVIALDWDLKNGSNDYGCEFALVLFVILAIAVYLLVTHSNEIIN